MVSRIAASVALVATVVHAQVPSIVPGSVSRFSADSIVVMRGGTPNGPTLTSVAQPITMVEYSTSGQALSTVAMPTATSGGNFRCMGMWTASITPELFMQRSFDGTVLAVPCNDVTQGAANPPNITTRVVGIVRADGVVDTSTRISTMFRDSNTATQYRTVTTVDGASFWATGTTSTSSHGLHYFNASGTRSTRVAIWNAANQRYVHVGPSWPGSGQPPSVPQLYVSMRDPVGQRGVHYFLGPDRLPTNNITIGSQSVLLPGFAAINIATNNIVTPLVASFCFEPDARSMWMADTQGWQALVPATVGTGRINLVQMAWSDASLSYVRGISMTIDSDDTFTGTQVQQITGRLEVQAGGSSAFTVYAVNNAKLYRMVPTLGLKTVIATAPAGTYFGAVAIAPVNPLLVPPSQSATPTTTSSATASVTASASVTGSATASPTSSLTGGAEPSVTSSATASPSPIVPVFRGENVLILAAGNPGNNATFATVSNAMFVLEYSPSGDLVSTRALPTITSEGAEVFACAHTFATGGYQAEFFAQLSYNKRMMVFPCDSAVPFGASRVNNITSRVINTMTVDGRLKQQVVRTAFRDSTAGTVFRTITTVDGSGFWMTGATSSGASNGLHYVAAGSSVSERVSVINAGNQRYVHVGPSYPGLNVGPTTPQLYVSMRDPAGLRGVHMVGAGLPQFNVTDGTVLLPGFEAYQGAATNITMPLVGSMAWESDRSVWLCDTQGWQTLVPATTTLERMNLVNFVYSDATGSFVRGMEMPVDSSLAYVGSQVQAIHGRYEDGVWVIYTVNNLKMFRVVPSTRTVTIVAAPPTGLYFISSAFVPEGPSDMVALTASATRTASTTATPTSSLTASASTTGSMTSSPSATLSSGTSPSASATPTTTATGSITASRTATPPNTPSRSVTGSVSATRSETPSMSATASPSASVMTPSPTGSPSASRTPPSNRYLPENLLLLRGGIPGTNISAVAQPLSIVEMTPYGEFVSSINLTATAAALGLRCVLGFGTGYQLEGFMQRSFNGRLVTFPCNNLPSGVAQPNNITSRVVGVVNAEGGVTMQEVRTAFRDSTSGTLFRTVATEDGTSFYLGGSTSSMASAGLHYLPAGSASTERVVIANAALARFVHVGPSWPGSGQPPSVPQLYASFRDPVGWRAVHALGSPGALPTANLSISQISMLPGFAQYQTASNNLTTPLIGTFGFSADARTLVTVDTQGWQSIINAPGGNERINLVIYTWSDATQSYVLESQLSVDAPTSLGYSGNQVQSVAIRQEPAAGFGAEGPAVLVVYFANNARVFRCVPSLRTTDVIAYAEPGTFFYSIANVPFVPSFILPSASATRSPGSATPSRTATPSISQTRTASPTQTGTQTPSRTPSSTTSATGSASLSAAPSVTASASTTGTSAATGTATGSGTGSSAATTSQTGTPSASGTGSRTGTPSASGTGSRTGTGTGTSSASGTGTQTGTPSSSSTGSQTGTPSSSGTGSQTGTPSTSGTGTAASTQTSSLSSTGTPASTGTGTPAVSGTATKTRVPLPSSSPTRTRTRTASRTKTKTRTRTRTPSKKKLMA